MGRAQREGMYVGDTPVICNVDAFSSILFRFRYCSVKMNSEREYPYAYYLEGLMYGVCFLVNALQLYLLPSTF